MRRFLLAIFILYSGYSWAQSARNDSSFVADATKNAITLYTKGIGAQSHIYNGNAYTEYQQQQDEHPYYADEWLEGSVVYEDELYQKIPLLYDISSDRLIIDHQYNINKLQLVRSKVKSFTLQQHQFVALNEPGTTTGFYEVLYDGKTKVYAQWKKIMQETITNQSIERRFDEKTLYFIRKDGKMYQVKSKKSVLKVLADKKPELRKNSGTASFKMARGKAISELAQYYDQLQ